MITFFFVNANINFPPAHNLVILLTQHNNVISFVALEYGEKENKKERKREATKGPGIEGRRRNCWGREKYFVKAANLGLCDPLVFLHSKCSGVRLALS